RGSAVVEQLLARALGDEVGTAEIDEQRKLVAPVRQQLGGAPVARAVHPARECLQSGQRLQRDSGVERGLAERLDVDAHDGAGEEVAIEFGTLALRRIKQRELDRPWRTVAAQQLRRQSRKTGQIADHPATSSKSRGSPSRFAGG